MSIAQFEVTHDAHLGQYVAQYTIGKHRFATLMGRTEPEPYQLTEAEKRLFHLAAGGKRKRSNYVSAEA